MGPKKMGGATPPKRRVLGLKSEQRVTVRLFAAPAQRARPYPCTRTSNGARKAKNLSNTLIPNVFQAETRKYEPP